MEAGSRDRTAPPEVEHLSRPQAIARLRERLKAFANDEDCVCAAVGRLGIFCRGFRRLTDQQLLERLDWIARKHPGVPREALEELANLYHLGRMEVAGAEICCDVETREHAVCDGWNTFDNAALEAFFRAVVGRSVRIG